MMFLVFELRPVGMSHRPPDSEVSGGKPLASLQAVMQALQPVQMLLSYNMPTASAAPRDVRGAPRRCRRSERSCNGSSEPENSQYRLTAGDCGVHVRSFECATGTSPWTLD